MEIIPGILEKEWPEIEKKLNLVKPFSKSVHIDFIDGKFAPDKTFVDPKPFSKFSKNFMLEAHLMVEDPIKYLKPLSESGFRRFLGHIEKMPNQEEFVAQGQLLGEVGLAVDGPTPIESLKTPLDDLDCILIMTIKAGSAGQKFMPEHLKKVEELRKMPNGLFLKVEIDGGVNDKSIVEGRSFGVDRFVANSYLYKDGDPSYKFRLLTEQVNETKVI